MAATEPDRRILILVAFAALFHLALAGAILWPEEPVDAPADPGALQLRWDGEGLAVGGDRAGLDVEDLPPDLAPFFFRPIPINRADARVLETVAGIGPHLASEIVRVRDIEGVVFRRGDDLLRVPGIGPKRLRQLEPQFSFAVPQ